MILTDVDAVYAGWGTDQQRVISSMSVSEADRLAREGAFGEGSMAPKVAAAADYVRRTNGRAIITELSKGRAAVQGVGGTEIIP
jgi:carbamate kinase